MGANAQTSVPLFVANTVLTAAQQNTSAATGIPVFATTATRDAAFGGSNKALAEGQMAYIETNDLVQYYSGSVWVDLVGSAWTSFTPTLSGWTIGNGSFTAAYSQIGRLVNVRGVFVGGSTTTAASYFDMTPPVAANAFYDTYKQPGISANYYDTSAGANYTLQGLWISTTIRIAAINTASTYAKPENMAGATPVTYGTGDFISFSYSYEAA